MNHEQSCMRQCFIMFHTEMSHAGQLHILSNRRMCVGWVMHWDKRGQQDRKLAHKLLLPWPTSVTAGYTDLSCFPFLMEHYGERGTLWCIGFSTCHFTTCVILWHGPLCAPNSLFPRAEPWWEPWFLLSGQAAHAERVPQCVGLQYIILYYTML